jgi:transposase
MDLAVLLPHLAGLVIVRWQVGPSAVEIEVASRALEGRCPTCRVMAMSVHSHYSRAVTDIPIGNRSVQLAVQVRRFRCRNPTCSRKTFAEDFAPLIRRYGRQTAPLQELLDDIGILVGGRPGARFARRHDLRVGRSTLIRLVRRLPLPPTAPPVVLGVDDFALRRNHHYGTLVIDLERHQLLDMWPERTAQPLIAWLREQAGWPDIICRDRAGTYADAARQGAPEARQVADRFHLACNASAVLERVLVRHAALVRTATALEPAHSNCTESNTRESSRGGAGVKVRPPPATSPPPPRATREARRACRLARYDQVLALYRAGATFTAIAQHVGLARATVRKYVHADGFPEWPPRRTPLRAGSVHMTHLWERWAAGCRDATILWAELRERRFTGSLRMVQRAVAGWRSAPRVRGPRHHPDEQPGADEVPCDAGPPPESLPAPPRGLSPQQAVWLLLRPEQELTDTEQHLRAHLLVANEEIRTAHAVIACFRDLLRTRGHEQFTAWQEAAHASGIPEVRGFVANLQRDEEAVREALTEAWNSGQVEGQVTMSIYG